MDVPGITQPTFRSLSSTASVESDEMEDEEIDQLDSDTDEEPLPPVAAPAAASSASAKPPPKTRPKVPVERVPGKSMIPLTRIESLLEADGEESFMSKEAVFILAAATEEFVKRLMEAGHRSAQASKRAMVNYRDVASATSRHQEFKFLEDTIPQPISLAAALQRRAAKEKELLEEPAISVNPVLIPSVAPSIAASDTPSGTPDVVPPTKKRTRSKIPPQTNGDANGDAHPSTASEPKRTRERRSRKKGPDDQTASAPVPIKEPPPPTHSHRTRRSSRSQRGVELAEMSDPHPPPSHTNGHSISMNGRSSTSHRSSRSSSERGTMAPPPPSRDMDNGDEETDSVFVNLHGEVREYVRPAGYQEVDSEEERDYVRPVSYRGAESWPPPAGHPTGPASGYLDDRRMLFNGRNPGLPANPGRTIYNAHRPPNR